MLYRETITLLLIGKTGNGKSTLANIISQSNDFKEGEFMVSETKDHLKREYIIDGIRYIIVDTCGIGDTELTMQQVLYKIAEACYTVRDGLNQVLFVTSQRFTKEEQLAYNILTGVIFNPEIVNYTTVVRTNFPGFRVNEKCVQDTTLIAKETPDLAKMIESCNKVIHVNNLTAEEEPSLQSRQDSRLKLITHLASCKTVYKPKELDQLNEKIAGYMTDAQKAEMEIQKLMMEIQDIRNQGQADKERLSAEIKEYQNQLVKSQQEIARVTRQQIESKDPSIWSILLSAFAVGARKFAETKCSIQ
ncbi:hypothetical protein CYY_005854 [Polysphondylium violaceum]|uniref:AIG1-type G domain-containing protein n=1 Tax=Polysphondylium violaceum TaxID=133409 RepID=A0A8J4PRC5_9MYCE|nr:hypothetical protein CYY_005854 [Polysphondylium violaceum]